jgi:hypothetical protein
VVEVDVVVVDVDVVVVEVDVVVVVVGAMVVVVVVDVGAMVVVVVVEVVVGVPGLLAPGMPVLLNIFNSPSILSLSSSSSIRSRHLLSISC